jgi:hypothetical protein
MDGERLLSEERKRVVTLDVELTPLVGSSADYWDGNRKHTGQTISDGV